MSERILIVDDDEAQCDFLRDGLATRGYEVRTCLSGEQALEALAAGDVELVVTDLNLGGMDGITLCERIVSASPDVVVLVITGFGSIQNAVAAVRAGAYDFIPKPVDLEALDLTLRRALRHRALRVEVKQLRRAVADAQGFGEFLGTSPAMNRVYDLLERAADSDATVLVTGESGTGKELAARALHERSRRRNGPFVAVNCSAIPETLLEGQLFGHVKGAFTDARESRTGLFLQATGGTLFLDEIAEMPLALQPKLLRALQERTVRPIGGAAEVPFDARIVAASNRDLEFAVEEGRFREDLLFRVDVVRIALPPLRARGGDSLLLAGKFVERFAQRDRKTIDGFSARAAEKILAYAWPGNVRELQNCIERAVVLTRSDKIDVADLPARVREFKSSHVVVAGDDPSELPPMEEVERRYVLRVLQAVGGSKVLAAKVLGFDRKTLYRKLQGYGAIGEEAEREAGRGEPAARGNLPRRSSKSA
ncbi:MAG: sigma-54-dependent Fis family transcriptional regulator [Deltaproteobacteria bacterium]|nr:sigma-54-dependent Fis family transcriptional regulator [Deltaproteobacteria bacterium]